MGNMGLFDSWKRETQISANIETQKNWKNKIYYKQPVLKEQKQMIAYKWKCLAPDVHKFVFRSFFCTG